MQVEYSILRNMRIGHRSSTFNYLTNSGIHQFCNGSGSQVARIQSNVPVLLMVACNIIDYATGIFASKYRNQPVDSYKGFRGIAKKISMWLLVVVGAIVDQLLKYAAATIGITMPITFLIACVVAIWIICNEIISILENIKDIGAPVPPFLLPLLKNLKSQVEEVAKTEEK